LTNHALNFVTPESRFGQLDNVDVQSSEMPVILILILLVKGFCAPI